MDTTDHSHMASLFEQLGLSASNEDIERFVSSHSLDAGVSIEKAPFWTTAQASFLEESISEDSDWAELVDQLAVLLRA
ncbi:DUF2789 domain-containing protein [Reinekea forsetii]|nr:DUF2789 domain-containing protein [Reinekea forsetii]